MSAPAYQIEPSGAQIAAPKRFPVLLRLFEPEPAAAVMLSEPELIKTKHRYWERRMIVATIVGYATYYFVRK
ncbi:MAG: hypothetical protein NTX51_05125, partial [Verrucomicrobia bacterium]|nr:hypothetical protein [Verrucomicrobiota bacterium]